MSTEPRDELDPDIPDVEAAPGPTDEQLGRIRNLALAQVDILRTISRLENELQQAKQDLKVNTEVELPAAMTDAGLESFTLSGGWKLELSVYYMASIPTGERLKGDKLTAALAKRSAWFHWLRSNNHDSIIKREIIAKFGKGDDKAAGRLKQYLLENFPMYDVADRESVHAGTLGAFVKEQMAAGTVFPDELGVATVRAAEIKQPKNKETF